MRAVISTADLRRGVAGRQGGGLARARRPRPGRRGGHRPSRNVGHRSPARLRAPGRHRRPARRRPRYRVVAIDSGIKYNILRRLAEAGCEVTVVPPTTLGRGRARARARRRLLRQRTRRPRGGRLPLRDAARAARRAGPVFGICLGHQMLSLAVGAETFKLKYGHRGGNQPVMNLLTRPRRDHEPEPRLLRRLRQHRRSSIAGATAAGSTHDAERPRRVGRGGRGAGRALASASAACSSRT